MSTRVPREKAIFIEALEFTDPAKRREFLDQACGADKDLRARVENLLALSQNAGNFFEACAPALEADPAELKEALSGAESAFGVDPAESKNIGPYKLLQKLGEGGCGVVYMAEQEQPIRRRVALKIIKLGMDTRNVIARFEAERQALALMDHPNIARVLDAGATKSGRPYFVMELVYGVKITEYCDQNRLGMRERLALFIQVCNAVQHAHQKGIIHRDLKPSNIMVTMHDGVPVPKVIDFGIAKATEQRLTDKTLFTSYAQLMGTPAYMSPEQMELSGLNLDTRSDIYSLGVLLYQLLTGRTPFDTGDLLKMGVDELRRTVCEQDPLSPSAKLRTLTDPELTKTALLRRIEPPRLLSEVRGDLDWIVLKCLEKDRTRRYEGANALALDLQRYLNEETVLARPPSQLYRLQKLARRNRKLFVVAAAGVAFLILGTITSTLMFISEREARRSEARLRIQAEAQENASHLALLVAQRRFDEADKLAPTLALDRPSIESSAELRALGDWHAVHGRWREAASRFQAAVQVDQNDSADQIAEDKLKLALTLLKAGNAQGYAQLRQAEFSGINLASTFTEYRTLKIALLLPPDGKIIQFLNMAQELLDKSSPLGQTVGPDSPHRAELAEVRGLLEYRQGNFLRALDWCEFCQSRLAPIPAVRAITSLIQAMASWHSQVGWYQSAQVKWSVGCELIQAKSEQGLNLGSESFSFFPGAEDNLEGGWDDWVLADLLRQECDSLFEKTDRELPPMSRSGNQPKTFDLGLYSQYRSLGEWHGIHGQWEQARRRFEDVLQFQVPDDWSPTRDYCHEGLALLKLGDKAAFARTCEAAVAHCSGTTNEEVAQGVINTTLLVPPADALLARLEPLAQMLSRAVAAAEPMQAGVCKTASWDVMSLALWKYRGQDYRAARDLCQKSLATCTYVAMPTVQDRAILAMSLQKLGEDAAAREELSKAQQQARSGLNSDIDSWNWREWICARFLLQEAEGLLLDGRPASEQPSGPISR